MRRKESHLFSCAEMNPALCAEAEQAGIVIPDLQENKRLVGINWQQSMSYALNLNNQVQLSVPVIVQVKEYVFTEVETGTAYTPPDGYASLFHPDQQILGFGDVQLAGQHYFFLSDLVVGLEVGVRLPTASTKFNEYSLLEFHQPLGTGTVVPTSKVILFSRGEKHGVLSTLGTQVPVYENADSYRTGASGNVDVGYWRRLPEQGIVLLSQLSVQHENRDTWYDQNIPYSYRSFLRASLMGTYAFSDNLEGMMRMEMQVMRKVWEDDIKDMKINNTPVFNVGLTWL